MRVPSGSTRTTTSRLLVGQSRHGLERVQEEIERDLLELDPVAPYRPEAGSDVERHPAVAQDRVAVDEPHDIAKEIADVERPEGGGLFANERAQPLDHLTRPVVVLDDVFQDLAHLRQVGGAGAEKTLRRLHVAQNGGERLIELVRQRRRQLAHRREARHVGKLRAMALRLVLRRAAFLDGGRQEHHGNGHRDQEELKREHVVRCRTARKRPEPADSAGDRE